MIKKFNCKVLISAAFVSLLFFPLLAEATEEGCGGCIGSASSCNSDSDCCTFGATGTCCDGHKVGTAKCNTGTHQCYLLSDYCWASDPYCGSQCTPGNYQTSGSGCDACSRKPCTSDCMWGSCEWYINTCTGWDGTTCCYKNGGTGHVTPSGSLGDFDSRFFCNSGSWSTCDKSCLSNPGSCWPWFSTCIGAANLCQIRSGYYCGSNADGTWWNWYSGAGAGTPCSWSGANPIAWCNGAGSCISDATAPSTSCTPNGDWTTAARAFSLSCSDDASGCSATYYKIIDATAACGTTGFTAGTSGTISCTGSCNKTVCYYSVDVANNQESVKKSAAFTIVTYTTMTGSATSWNFGGVGSSSVVVRSGSPTDWTWRTTQPLSGRQVPQGSATSWTWQSE